MSPTDHVGTSPVARPGELAPNELEVALLERITSASPDVRLSIPELQVLSRTITGVGSFTEFSVPGWPTAQPRRVITTCPEVPLPTLRHGLGVVAFIEGDRLTLETYSYGDDVWDGRFDGFAISPATQPSTARVPEGNGGNPI